MRKRLVHLTARYRKQYEAYIHSAAWRTVRASRLARDGGKCCQCGGKAHEVHHKRFPLPEEFGKETLDMLVSLCRSCHQLRHCKDRALSRKTAKAKKDYGKVVAQNAYIAARDKAAASREARTTTIVTGSFAEKFRARVGESMESTKVYKKVRY